MTPVDLFPETETENQIAPAHANLNLSDLAKSAES